VDAVGVGGPHERFWIFVSATKRLMAAFSSSRDRKTPRLRRQRVSLAKKVSTALSQDAEVGVKGKVQRRWRASHDALTHLGMFVRGVVVDDGMDRHSPRYPRLDSAELGWPRTPVEPRGSSRRLPGAARSPPIGSEMYPLRLATALQGEHNKNPMRMDLTTRSIADRKVERLVHSSVLQRCRTKA
jgi:hypothetical protein